MDGDSILSQAVLQRHSKAIKYLVLNGAIRHLENKEGVDSCDLYLSNHLQGVPELEHCVETDRVKFLDPKSKPLIY